MVDAQLEKIYQLLAQPSFYHPQPASVQVVHTHISAVFIAQPFVYKLKKPKNFGFLDFTTLEKRKHYCQQEVLLNRRLSDNVYLDVLSIVEDQETGVRFSHVDDPKAIEYCVKMRYLEPAGIFSHLIRHQKATTAHIERIANRLIDFYQQMPTTKLAAEYATADSIRFNLMENFQQTEPFVGQWVLKPWIAWNQIFVEAFFTRFADLFVERVAQQHVLEAHGDLHAEHIHFADGTAGSAVNFVDCIEFNDRFRCLDYVNDVAFLAMDLDVLGTRALGEDLFRAFDRLLPDPQRATLLPLYLSYRAFVRGKVASLTAASKEIPPTVQQTAVASAKQYLAFATRYSLVGYQPTIIAFCGPTGSGKSTLANALEPILCAPHFASDRIRRQLTGLAPNQPSNSELGAGIYTAELHEKTYETLIEQATQAAKTQGLSIVEATFLEPSRRQALSQACRQKKIKLIWVALSPTEDILNARVTTRPQNGESEATPDVLKEHLLRWQVPTAAEGDVVLHFTQPTTLDALGNQLVQAHLQRLSAA